MSTEATDLHEALMQFLYRAPIGLAEMTPDGTIEMLNPMAAQLLMSVSAGGTLDNLFSVLEGVAPELRQMTRDFHEPSGTICEGLRLDLSKSTAIDHRSETRVLAISLLKLHAERLMVVLADATSDAVREREKLARGLSAAALTDTLTQMPNRAAVREKLQQMIDLAPAGRRPDFAVLFMNCDRFKQINDTLGHAAGDAVLGMMAERLRSCLRLDGRDAVGPALSQMAARIGSDEFVVVLTGVRRVDDVMGIAGRVLEALSVPYQADVHRVSCTASIGVLMSAQIPGDGDADGVLQDASIAMAEAKQAGGACHVMFETRMRERAAERGGLESDLRRAMSEDELFVVYQPVVGMQATGDDARCVGVEALVRWKHPARGTVQPLEFIQIAEECGLIEMLGDFVLSRACRDFMAWHRRLGHLAPATLAVNVSRAQVAKPQWPERVATILRSTGMPPERLQLEITESLAAQDETVQAGLHQLKALGLTLALDDFGTGYSSLACLHLLPVDTVKIDRSFVCQADISMHHQVLIDATVRVAHSLGMNTVAEGIETQAQADIVKRLGCEKGQGYLFSRPLTSAALETWLTADALVDPDSAP